MISCGYYFQVLLKYEETVKRESCHLPFSSPFSLSILLIKYASALVLFSGIQICSGRLGMHGKDILIDVTTV